MNLLDMLNRLAIVAGLVALGYIIWDSNPEYWGRTPKYEAPTVDSASESGAAGPRTAPTGEPSGRSAPAVCAQCAGTGLVPCTVCGGKGKVTRAEQVRCEQCGGTGRYKSRVGGGDAPCPFCNGTGYQKREMDARCPACNGTGKVPCPACTPRRR